MDIFYWFVIIIFTVGFAIGFFFGYKAKRKILKKIVSKLDIIEKELKTKKNIIYGNAKKLELEKAIKEDKLKK